jgi:hypothetical protein
LGNVLHVGKKSIPPHATLRLELRNCGDPKCTRLHGPYWYAYFRVGKRTCKRYVGKHLPKELARRRMASSSRRRASHDVHVLEELALDDVT